MKQSEIKDSTLCVVDIHTVRIWDFFHDYKTAVAKQTTLNDESELGGGSRPYSIMMLKEFFVMEKAKWVTGEITQISEEQYWEMLEVLPPLRWKRGGTVETFCMVEFMTSSFTEQYGCRNNVYICKMIDYTDPSTEITIDDFKGLEPLC